MSSAATTSRTSRHRAVRLILAGIAVLGVGFALTSAAWTDNVFFSADAEAGSFNLQGSVDGVAYAEHDTAENAAIVLPTDVFENLSPGDVATATVWVQNAGTVEATLSTPDVTLTGPLFGGASPAEVTVDDVGGTTLAPGADTEIEVTLTVPDWTGDDYFGAAGAILIEVSGQS